MLAPDMFIQLSKARMVSPTGQCHTFSDKADGYTRGEGCGVVILKRLKDVGVNCSLPSVCVSYYMHRNDVGVGWGWGIRVENPRVRLSASPVLSRRYFLNR